MLFALVVYGLFRNKHEYILYTTRVLTVERTQKKANNNINTHRTIMIKQK